MSDTDLTAIFADRHLIKRSTPRYRETVYAVIKDAIMAGKLPVGQPLVEEQLAHLLDISRTPVREALIILEHEQIIGPSGGRGLYVHILSRDAFVEMFEANEAIEPVLARRAAHQISEEQLVDLEAALESGRRCIAKLDLAGFLGASRVFHRVVGEAAGNQPLAAFVLNNEERTDMYLLNAGTVIDRGNMEASLREHRSIHEALAQRDPQSAERLTIYHAHSLRTRFAEFFTPLEDGAVD